MNRDGMADAPGTHEPDKTSDRGLSMVPDRLRKAAWRILKHSLHAKLANIERHSNGSRATYVGNNRVLVKCVVANWSIAYYVEADDRLLAPWFIITGRYEPELTAFLVRELEPDSHCIDVGANFGYFTCVMARFAPRGRVIGIEADRHVHEIVRDNIAINGFGHARAIHAAVSNEAGEITLFRRNTRSGNTSIAAADSQFTAALGETPVEPFSVATMRIDDLREELGGRLDFIKIDIEGAEPLAIEGAIETIAANPQLSILMEWSPGQIQGAGFDVGVFLDTLAALGLRPYDLIGRRPRALAYGDLPNLDYRAGILLRRAT